VRNSILELHWESADGRSKIAQIILSCSRANDLLTELHGGLLGGHLGVNKTLNKVLQRCYWLQARNDVEKWCRQCDTYAASRGPWTRNWGQMQQYNHGYPVERIAIDVVGPFPRSSRGNRCLLIVMGYVTKWPEAYAIHNQEALTVAESLVTNFLGRFGVPRELRSDHGHSFESRLLEEGSLVVTIVLHESETCLVQALPWTC
jgi:hypothetical protein